MTRSLVSGNRCPRIQLVEGSQTGVREGRPAPHPGVRLPTRSRHDNDPCGCTARRSRSPPWPQRGDTRVNLHRCDGRGRHQGQRSSRQHAGSDPRADRGTGRPIELRTSVGGDLKRRAGGQWLYLRGGNLEVASSENSRIAAPNVGRSCCLARRRVPARRPGSRVRPPTSQQTRRRTLRVGPVHVVGDQAPTRPVSHRSGHFLRTLKGIHGPGMPGFGEVLAAGEQVGVDLAQGCARGPRGWPRHGVGALVADP